jgi:preprotein translocase subunit Sec61beta
VFRSSSKERFSPETIVAIGLAVAGVFAFAQSRYQKL